MKLRASRAALALLGVACLSPSAPGQAQEPPAVVAITVDTSGSIRPELLEQIKLLASGVLARLPPDGQVAVFAFNDASSVVLDRTADAAAVEQAVQGLRRGGRFTALYDALYDASRYLKDAPPARKAIILVTDGKDENSSVQIEDGLKVAVESRIPVYCVGVGQVQEAVLRRIAKLTGGEYLPIAQAQAELLAQRIAELPAPATPAPATAPSATGTTTAPVAPAGAGGSTVLYVIAGVLVVALALGAAVLSRRKPPAAHAGEDGEATVAVRDGREDDDEDAAERTLVMRSPEVGAVERTVMLRLQPSLTVTRGANEGQVFPLGMDSAVSIGRAPSNDIPLYDSAVSGEHCRIRPEGGAFVLHDLQSTNGTYVNEKRVERHRLSQGDVIRVGETHFLFKLGPA